MKKIMFTIAVLALSTAVRAQEQTQPPVAQGVQQGVKIHRVALGETVVLIAKKYMVTPKDIYDINPDAVNGISANQALKIPLEKSIPKDEPVEQKLPVVSRPQPKPQTRTEAVRGAAQNASPEIAAAAPSAVSPPVTVPPAVSAAEVPSSAAVEAETQVLHLVKTGETLTGLARKYHTTIQKITAANKKVLKRGLQTGQKLQIVPGEAMEEAAVALAPAQAEAPVADSRAADAVPHTVEHQVNAGETLTGLARRYHTTIDAITSQNKRVLRRGLQTGQKLSITTAGNVAQ